MERGREGGRNPSNIINMIPLQREVELINMKYANTYMNLYV